MKKTSWSLAWRVYGCSIRLVCSVCSNRASHHSKLPILKTSTMNANSFLSAISLISICPIPCRLMGMTLFPLTQKASLTIWTSNYSFTKNAFGFLTAELLRMPKSISCSTKNRCEFQLKAKSLCTASLWTSWQAYSCRLKNIFRTVAGY